LVRRIKAGVAASRTRFGDQGHAAGRRMKQLAHSVWRRSRQAMAEVDRLTGEVAGLARRCRRSRWWSATPAAGLAVDQVIGRLGRLLGELHETMDYSSAHP
jgi:hypothetical protein